jgi:nucleoside-diphosphate-sugar epimerase
VQAGPEEEDFAMRVLFKGGSGRAGKRAVPYLVEQGHRGLNFDKVPLGRPGGHD